MAHAKKSESLRELPHLDRHLGIKEAAVVLGVPPSTLRTWVRQGMVPYVKFPGLRGRVIVKEEDIAALVQRLRVPSAAEVADRLRFLAR